MTCKLDYCDIHNGCVDSEGNTCTHANKRCQGLKPCMDCTNRNCKFELTESEVKEEDSLLSIKCHARPEDLLRLKEKLISEKGNLGNFYGSCEAETMIAQTILAACVNFAGTGNTFSIRGDNVFRGDNRKAYWSLLEGGMFIETVLSGRHVIFPTQALVNRLDEYFALRDQRRKGGRE